jgi:FkbM family methyltransferase
MGSRFKKLQDLHHAASSLELNPLDYAKLLGGTYLPRLNARFSFIPTPDFSIRFPFEGNSVHYHMRSNDLDHSFLSGIFLRHEYRVPVSPRRILDLGGNIGAADLYFHTAFPEAEIVTVEPLPENLAILRRNWQANAIRGKIIAAAVSDRSGEATFYLGPADCSSLIARPDIADHSITVKTMTIPEIMEQVGWQHIDLLKIDIEGGEVAVFRDSKAWANKVDCITGELHNGYSVADVERDLGGLFDCVQTFEYPAPGCMKGFLAVRKA